MSLTVDPELQTSLPSKPAWQSQPYISHLHNDGVGENTSVVDPSVIARFGVCLSPVGTGGIGVKKVPLWSDKPVTFVQLTSLIFGDGDPQQILFCCGIQSPVGMQVCVVAKKPDLAVMFRDGG